MNRNNLIWIGILLALGAHTGRGIFPVLSRYLQTVKELPTFMFMAVVGIPFSIVFIVQLFQGKYSKQLLTRAMWMMVTAAIMRTFFGNLGARFTLASFVQLFAIMTPFIVVFLNGLFFKEKLPKYTIWATVLCTIGAVLMLSSDLTQQGLSFKFTSSDILGISFAIIAAIATALYLLSVRNAVKYSDLSPVLILSSQTIAISTIALVCSLLIGESLEPWRNLSLTDWGIIAVFSLIVVIGSNALQILALKFVSAPAVSSMMAWRLVVTLILGYFILGETLESVSQIIGAILVAATVTWYLWMQRSLSSSLSSNLSNEHEPANQN